MVKKELSNIMVKEKFKGVTGKANDLDIYYSFYKPIFGGTDLVEKIVPYKLYKWCNMRSKANIGLRTNPMDIFTNI